MRRKMDKAIGDIFDFMSDHNPDSEEYSKAVHNLKELCDAKGKLNPELLAVLAIVVPAVTSIVTVVIIIKHEELNVITTKALAFVMKGRL